MKLKHIFLAVFGLLCTYAYSQDMGYFYAGGRVTNVIQENDSIYWVSTFTGLRKINSNNNNITHLNRLNTEMPSNQIYDLAFDNDGRLWLATHEGLAMISDSLSLVYNTSNSSIPADIITTVSVDQQGRIWGGTYWDGFFILSDGVIEVYNSSTNYDIIRINNIEFDSEGTAWMASGSPGNIGLIKFANNTLTKYTTDNSDIPENDVERVLVDEDDKIWIAMDKYVAVFDQTNWNVLEEITTANDIRGMDLDQAGNVWIATYSDGIANYINDQWNFYSPDNTTEITYLGNIFIDNNNDILTCSYNEGLSKFSDFDWSKIDISNCPLANDVTDQIEFETNGTAWIRNRWGQILKFKDNNWEVFDTETLIPESEAILYLHVDQNDHKWIVFRNEAYEFFTLFYDDVNWSVFSIPALPNITEMVRSFVVSYDGTPILAMREGVYEFTGTEWVNSQIYDEVEWDDLGFLALGSNNDLWITNISRLYKKDNSGINQVSFDTLIDMPSAIITSLVVDQNNNLWFTLVNTSERRLIFFDGESFIVDRTLEFNSPNQSLPSTLIDNNNLLWIADRGLLPQIYKRNGPDLWDTLNVKNSNILSDITVSDISQNPANGDFWIAHPIFGITVYNEQGNILPVESPFKKTEEITIDIFPNPFKNQISIHYTIKRAKSLSLLLYDQNGRLIKSIFKDKRHQEGSHDYSLDNLNLDPGIYYCIIKSSKEIYARKIIRIE